MVTNITFTINGDTSAQVTWSPPGASLLAYNTVGFQIVNCTPPAPRVYIHLECTLISL